MRRDISSPLLTCIYLSVSQASRAVCFKSTYLSGQNSLLISLIVLSFPDDLTMLKPELVMRKRDRGVALGYLWPITSSVIDLECGEISVRNNSRFYYPSCLSHVLLGWQGLWAFLLYSYQPIGLEDSINRRNYSSRILIYSQPYILLYTLNNRYEAYFGI